MEVLNFSPPLYVLQTVLWYGQASCGPTLRRQSCKLNSMH